MISRAPAVRFAPSPTGDLHVGNLRTALYNWLWARGNGCRFVLRIDDTDPERSRPEFVESIHRDLRWMSLIPDETVYQSERLLTYRASLDSLLAKGRVYPCFETEDELARKRSAQKAAGRSPRYDRSALALTPPEREAALASGRPVHWRFRLSDHPVTFNDAIRGPTRVNLRSQSDPVIRRSSGAWLYTFTSVVDDIALGVSQIIRGEDHVTNTGIQIDMFAAMDHPPPAFAHHNLMTDAQGAALSKRDGALSVASLRKRGIEAEALAFCLVGLEMEALPPCESTLEGLTKAFKLSALSRSPVQFDLAELKALNRQLLSRRTVAQIAKILDRFGVPQDRQRAFWETVRENINTLDESKEWWQILGSDVWSGPLIEPRSREMVEFACRTIPPRFAEPAAARDWLQSIQSRMGAKQTFRPLRRVLTGRETGPSLPLLVHFLGSKRVRNRLERSLAMSKTSS